MLAKHSLYLFEKDFDGLGFNTAERYNVLHKFLLLSPVNKLHVLVHDTHYLSTRCPRMVSLLHQFSTTMFIYQTPASLHQIAAPFAVADGEHLVRRFHFDEPQGVISTYDPQEAHAFKVRFTEMWVASHPASSFTRLRL